MNMNRWAAWCVIGVLAAGLPALTGCEDDDNTGDGSGFYRDNGDGTGTYYDNIGDYIASNWYDASTGVVTTINPNGTYSVSSGGAVWQTGTWTTSGSQITFYPSGDVPATMNFSLSNGGNTMTIVDDGEVTVLTR
jgi:hypothetical protein